MRTNMKKIGKCEVEIGTLDGELPHIYVLERKGDTLIYHAMPKKRIKKYHISRLTYGHFDEEGIIEKEFGLEPKTIVDMGFCHQDYPVRNPNRTDNKYSFNKMGGIDEFSFRRTTSNDLFPMRLENDLLGIIEDCYKNKFGIEIEPHSPFFRLWDDVNLLNHKDYISHEEYIPLLENSVYYHLLKEKPYNYDLRTLEFILKQVAPEEIDLFRDKLYEFLKTIKDRLYEKSRETGRFPENMYQPSYKEDYDKNIPRTDFTSIAKSAKIFGFEDVMKDAALKAIEIFPGKLYEKTCVYASTQLKNSHLWDGVDRSECVSAVQQLDRVLKEVSNSDIECIEEYFEKGYNYLIEEYGLTKEEVRGAVSKQKVNQAEFAKNALFQFRAKNKHDLYKIYFPCKPDPKIPRDVTAMEFIDDFLLPKSSSVAKFTSEEDSNKYLNTALDICASFGDFRKMIEVIDKSGVKNNYIGRLRKTLDSFIVR